LRQRESGSAGERTLQRVGLKRLGLPWAAAWRVAAFSRTAAAPARDKIP